MAAQCAPNLDPGTPGRKSSAPCLENGTISQHGFEFKLEILKASMAPLTHGKKSLAPRLENGTEGPHNFEFKLEFLKSPRAPVV